MTKSRTKTSLKLIDFDAARYLDDDEAAAIWIDEIKLPPSKLQRLGEDENFWPANAPSMAVEP